MKKRFKYTFLGIGTIIIHALTLLGAYMVYSSVNQMINATSSKSYFSRLSATSGLSGNSIAFGSKIFLFGLVATIVISIILAIYYIYEERKLIVLISSIVGFVETLLFLMVFGSIAELLTSGLSSLLFSSNRAASSISSAGGTLLLTLVIVVLGLVFQIVVVLQLMNVLHLTFLEPYMPNQYQMVNQQPVHVNGNNIKEPEYNAQPTQEEVETPKDEGEHVEDNIKETQNEGGQNDEENL